MFIYDWRDFDKAAEKIIGPLFDCNLEKKKDYKEYEKEFVIELEVPGVNKDDIKISGKEGTQYGNINNFTGIVIEWKDRKGVNKAKYYYLPNFDIDGAKVELNNGLLVIKVPKRKIGRTKDIPIK